MILLSLLWECKYKISSCELLLSSIYKVHDEAKDKAFELEMSWVCDESKQQHQKVISHTIFGYALLSAFFLHEVSSMIWIMPLYFIQDFILSEITLVLE